MNKQSTLSIYYNLAYKNNQPVTAVLEVTTKCNLNCIHCYLPEHNCGGMDTKTILRILTEMYDIGVAHVLLTGGEIFLREDILDIIKYARNLHMRVTLLTNGTLLNENMVTRLSELYITEVSTTLFSMNEKVHDRITRVNNSFAMLMDNLKLLTNHNIRIKIKMPLMKYNWEHMEEVRRYCENNNYEFLTSPVLFPKNDGNNEPLKFRICKNELKCTVDKLDLTYSFEKSYVHLRENPCMAIFYSFAIDSSGDVFPCNSFQVKVGNIYKDSLSDIWNHSEKLKYIKSLKTSDLKHCKVCTYKAYCERCPGMAYMENNDFLGCDSFAKQVAEIRVSRQG